MRRLLRPLLVSLWFMLLTLPIMVIRVNTITDTVEWRWERLALVAGGSFVLSLGWSQFIRSRRAKGTGERSKKADMLQPLRAGHRRLTELLKQPRNRTIALCALAGIALIFPLFSSIYQVSILNSALTYIVLGLGLNIIIGLSGMLHLGYIAFYAVGAYTYGILNHYFGVSFWIALPLGALLAVILSILVGIPTLRLRGDYLAIVTLAFGEIVRIVLENWDSVTFGPRGIANIERPGLFGLSLSLSQATIYIYFILLALVTLTIFTARRLESSRIGRSWEAMKEDDVAARLVGVNLARAKLTALTMGAFWAGLAGVIFAARTTFINPPSFTVWESIIVLCAVVLGGIGSIPGVALGALILILLPEYLRFLSGFRLLMFGAVLVLMMIFRPSGMIRKRRRFFTLSDNLPEQDAS